MYDKNADINYFCTHKLPIESGSSSISAAWVKQRSAYAKTKAKINFTVTTKLSNAFVFATWIVQFLYFLNPKFPASNHLLSVQPGLCETWSTLYTVDATKFVKLHRLNDATFHEGRGKCHGER